jgi:hypothetical protein
MGYINTASNFYSVAMGSSNSSGGSASIAMGVGGSAPALASVSIGGYNTASGSYSLAMGYTNTSSNVYSVALGYYNNSSGDRAIAIGMGASASGDSSLALGAKSSTNSISSKVAIGTLFSGVSGAYQMGQLLLGAITTDATATVLKSDTNVLSANNQCTLQNNNAMSFNIEVVARNTSTGMTGKWEAKGLIKRGANASTTALVGTPTVTLTNGDSEGWITAGAIAITADTTYGALAVTVTGAASTTIHWMCRINTVEVV